MSTENERVAGYIIPEIYERFEQFCQENKLNCSRALNVILAEYFGLEEALIFKQTWAGGITLAEFEKLQQEVAELSKLKQEVEQLKELVNKLSNVQSITPQSKEIKEGINKEKEESQEEISKKIKEKINKKVKEGLSQKSKSNDKESTQELSTTKLAKRFKINRATINRYKKKFRENKISKEEYIEWTRSKDPEGKGWFFDEKINYSI